MSDKRTVHTDALDTLGTIIDHTAKRDAIHLAVYPAIAGGYLKPGGHVYLQNGMAFLDDSGEDLAIGIVDPFLDDAVEPGQRFWLVVYPRKITSLRHVWTHPAFPDASDAPSPDRAASEKWLREFCENSVGPGYEDMMRLISGGSIPGWDLDDFAITRLGLTAHGDIPDEFWTHAEIVLGCKLAKHPTHFSCSC